MSNDYLKNLMYQNHSVWDKYYYSYYKVDWLITSQGNRTWEYVERKVAQKKVFTVLGMILATTYMYMYVQKM